MIAPNIKMHPAAQPQVSAKRYAIVLAGGSGTRLWPLSRSSKPKQLLCLNGAESLLQQTVRRVLPMVDPARVLTVTSAEYRFEVAGQLLELNAALAGGVMAEPMGRNTLPAIAWAVGRIARETPDALIGVFSSDHAVANDDAFLRAWQSAEAAAKEGYVALFGMQPTEAATGYGYIQSGKPLAGANSGPLSEAHQAARFVEKPDLATAQGYLSEGGYYWNGGMFVFRADRFMEMVKQHQPQLLITDVDMPNMDGIELSRRFREVTNEKLAPIIILSAMLDQGTRLAGLEAGAIDYVTKPFDPIELKARVRAQFRMRELAVRLHRAEQLSTLGVLTSGLAHELRNPANGVINALAPIRALLPKEFTEGDAPVGQLLGVMQECAEQINVLSKQLLGFRNDSTELQLRPTQMGVLVQRALSLTKPAFIGVEARVDVAVDAMVSCAPPLFLQVLTNLLENAAYAAGKGGWVEIAGRVDGGRVLLEVADSGPGVPAHLRTTVFEPFFTTKPQGVGTGLGLSVSREIVTRHRGILELRERGQRHVFVVDLPAHSALDATASAG